ncbi:MAG: hypothetical protein K6E61_04015 [Bacteroidales bacterium]|nr:hypothetical protein [Bacteroidales bacterium]
MKKLFKTIAGWFKEMRNRPDDWESMDYYERKLYTASVGLAGIVVLFPVVVIMLIVTLCSQSCSTPGKLQRIQKGALQVSIGLVDEPLLPPTEIYDLERPDTLVVRDDDGREYIIMKAVKDEDGEMVATDVIPAAVVEARFRHVAERQGKVDIEFQIRVPREMQDERWQLRFYPQMYILADTLDLEKVIVTGAKYRKAQLRGYQQYERFLASIVTDSTRFINIRLLELFIQRNIPDLYAFKTDSTIVSDAQFQSVYGVTEQDAIEHYTNTISKRLNARRLARRDEMYRKYIRVPIVREGLRLDTVIVASNGDFVYDYLQTIAAQPGLRKVDVVLSGDIWEQDKRLYEIPGTEPLTYYISSLSAFVDATPHYKKQIISRRVEANTACYIDFGQGSDVIQENLSNNRSEMGRIKDNLASLIENKEFDLDSIVVTASCSPEGSVAFNTKLSQRRSESVSRYFENYMQDYREQLQREAETAYYFGGTAYEIPAESWNDVKFISRSNPENWRMLDFLIEDSDSLKAPQKREYFRVRKIEDPDAREKELSKKPFYRYLREIFYPRLRTVKFDFHLHRKGMVQDTVQTTVLDVDYMAGVEALNERDYETALRLLRPYQDYNTALAYCALDYNASALAILEELPESAPVNYLLAVIYSRQGKDNEAVGRFIRACRQNPAYIHRGSLDPEISSLINRYNLINNYLQTH